jgi:hypothetical protein
VQAALLFIAGIDVPAVVHVLVDDDLEHRVGHVGRNRDQEGRLLFPLGDAHFTQNVGTKQHHADGRAVDGRAAHEHVSGYENHNCSSLGRTLLCIRRLFFAVKSPRPLTDCFHEGKMLY